MKQGVETRVFCWYCIIDTPTAKKGVAPQEPIVLFIRGWDEQLSTGLAMIGRSRVLRNGDWKNGWIYFSWNDGN